MNDQLKFAALSGDYNPIHISKSESRRLIYGEPVVHGVNAVLEALNILAKSHNEQKYINSLSVKFLKPIFLGINAEIEINKLAPADKVVCKIYQAKNLCCSINIDFEKSLKRLNKYLQNLEESPKSEYTQTNPEYVSFNNLENYSGAFKLKVDSKKIETNYSVELKNFLTKNQLFSIIGLSKIVGMHIPGINSLFSEIEIKSQPLDTSEMHYKVLNYDKRFNRVEIKVNTPSFKGRLKAFIRPQIKKQKKFSEIKKLVQKNEFKNQRAVVIGGSRGIGEISTKILCAGGANVFVTFNSGLKEVNLMKAEILDYGGKIKSSNLDIANIELESIKKIKAFNPTHLYYFATPFIKPGNKKEFSNELFQDFCKFYVDGFDYIQKYLGVKIKRHYFYPSTIFIEEGPLDFREYTMAKLRGENLCTLIEVNNPQISIFRPRMQKIKTDQNNTLLNSSNENSEDNESIILKYLRKFNKEYK